jgi:hypothetical protein
VYPESGLIVVQVKAIAQELALVAMVHDGDAALRVPVVLTHFPPSQKLPLTHDISTVFAAMVCEFASSILKLFDPYLSCLVTVRFAAVENCVPSCCTDSGVG